jgi:hypothetical protein
MLSSKHTHTQAVTNVWQAKKITNILCVMKNCKKEMSLHVQLYEWMKLVKNVFLIVDKPFIICSKCCITHNLNLDYSNTKCFVSIDKWIDDAQCYLDFSNTWTIMHATFHTKKSLIS